jgi:uncharacterized protein YlxW (UPF0749 family)
VLEDDTHAAARLVAELSDRAAALSAEVEALRNQVLAESDPTAAARVRALGVVSGALAVKGSGVELVLAPNVSVKDDDGSNRIQAGDLRVIVAGLWASGAEAVSVNGVRLTSLTALRDVGQVIQVELQPLSAPYTIHAIGPPNGLEVALASGGAATRLSLLKDYVGVSVSIDAGKTLEIPASVGAFALRYAVPSGKEDSP